jgi:FMN reductase
VKLAVVVGNPRPESRTLTIAKHVAESIGAIAGLEVGPVIDLATVANRLFSWPDETMSSLNEAVASSTLTVFASPTYKAAYTGVLKAFLDRYPSDGLRSTIGVPVMTGASEQHHLAVDLSLRPLLVELGASCPTSSLYFEMSKMDELSDVVNEWTSRNELILRGALHCGHV